MLSETRKQNKIKTQNTIKREKRKMTTRHYIEERQDRENRIKIIGQGKVIKSVVVDRGHRNGPEIHEITDTGIINIYNERTKKLVTKLIARPGQIKRYFINEVIPKGLLERAKYNCYTLAYNY